MARIYLAGAESIELLKQLVENDSKNIMLSFFYIQQRHALPHILTLLKQHPDLKVFLDSGSQTFLQKDHGDPQVYWKAYYALLREHGHRFEYASEFDIDGYQWVNARDKRKPQTVSDEQIEVWRDDLAELGSVPIVPVWHLARGKAALDALIADPRFPHIAFGRDGLDFKGEGGALINKVHAWNKTAHGFGQSAIDSLKMVKFDTVSSTTWLVGQRFGDAFIFEGGHLRRLYASSKRGKAERKKFRRYFERIGVNPDKIDQDDRKELNKANILAWTNFSTRLELSHAHKGPKRPTVAPGATNGSQEAVSPVPERENAVQGKSEAPRVSETHAEQRIIPLQPVESLTVEKTEQPAIELVTTKAFMPPSGFHTLMCATCVMALDCPKYSEGAVCAYREDFAKVGTRDVNQVVEEIASIFALNIERGRYLRLYEQLNGGRVDMDVTKHLDTTFQQGVKLAELMRGKKGVKTTAQGQGVISRLFGNLGAAPVRELTSADTEEHDIPEDYELEPEIGEVTDHLTDRQRRQLAQSQKIPT
jgi:hypothetical protein